MPAGRNTMIVAPLTHPVTSRFRGQLLKINFAFTKTIDAVWYNSTCALDTNARLPCFISELLEHFMPRSIISMFVHLAFGRVFRIGTPDSSPHSATRLSRRPQTLPAYRNPVQSVVGVELSAAGSAGLDL